MHGGDLRAAISRGDRKVAAMLRFLAEETEENFDEPAPLPIDAEQPAA